MTFLRAIILGIIQGLTEFLPVSSSGHLAICKNLFRMDTSSGILYDILLHVATLAAVCIVMWKDVMKLAVELIGIARDCCINIVTFFKNLFARGNKEDFITLASSSYRKFAILVIISSIPTAILGFLLKDIIETVEGELLVPGICLLATGVITLISDFLKDGTKKPKDATYGDAFSVGIAQGIATLPGLSRSGTTITACILCGFDRRFAVKYSFIMSIPAILGALLLEITDIGKETISGGEVASYIVGMIVAGVVGYFALKFVIGVVQKKSFKFFAVYCIGIGVVSIIAHIIKF